jgi:hypothetical protein
MRKAFEHARPKGAEMNREPEAWRRAYLEDGFVGVPDLLDAATLMTFREAD